jgi:colanic acid/amylovoran biosynthesis glycosyltransferase
MTEPPEIVFCTHDSPTSIGGPFTWLRQLLPPLRDAGYNIRVLALTHNGGTGPVVEGLRTDGFDVRVTDCPEHTEDAVRWILLQLGKSAPAIFVANFVVPALFAARWVREAGGATVGVLHSDDNFYRAIQQEFVLADSPFQLTDIVTVSESLQQEVLRQHPPNGLRSTYIPYGVHIPAIVERRSGTGLRIAYVGRLAEEQKRISLVAEALVAAAERIPGTKCVIFGDGPDRPNVLRVLDTQTKGIPVSAPGPLMHADVQARLLEYDVIALLSDYEGLPISLLEGMACGCVPVCRHMQSGIPQLVKHEQTGLIVGDSTDAFVNAMSRLTEEKLLLKQISTAAHNVIRLNYSHQSSVEKWTKLLRMCGNSVRPRCNLRIPRRLHLPSPNSRLEGVSARAPRELLLRRGLRRLRIRLGALRRRIW